MIFYIIVAILNGAIIGTSRAINSRLGVDLGPLKASFWNHIVGFIFLTLLLIATTGMKFDITTQLPLYTYFGGFFGALFVAVNSYVFPRIGAVKTILFVISGQMISSVLISYKSGHGLAITAQIIGVTIILLGVYLAKTANIRAENTKNNDIKLRNFHHNSMTPEEK